ncbi:MAG: hypothetical protein IKA48_00255 [Fibrobacter sp.]|nr:hypothetical protein [Fibrobacter sp.]
MRTYIEYEGRQLPIFRSDVPVTFGNKGKEMVIAHDTSLPTVEPVLAYIPGRDYPVITQYAEFEHCAELPECPEVNTYLPGTLLCRGKLSMVVSRPNSGKTELLCKSAIQACKAGNKVLFLSFELTADSVYRRCAMLLYDTLLPSTEQMNQVKSLVHPGELVIKEISKPISGNDIENMDIDKYDLLVLDGCYSWFDEGGNEMYCLALKHNKAILTARTVSRP